MSFRGDRITLCYEEILLPNCVRREKLMKGKKFECRCKRCRDPTEMGSDARYRENYKSTITFQQKTCCFPHSSLLCPKCKSAVRQSPSSHPESDFVCQTKSCAGGARRTYAEVRASFERLAAETDLMLNDPERNNVREFEKFLKKHSGTRFNNESK